MTQKPEIEKTETVESDIENSATNEDDAVMVEVVDLEPEKAELAKQDDVQSEEDGELAEKSEKSGKVLGRFKKSGKDGDAVPLERVYKRNLGFIQRDYINPKNLGFMKFILLCFGANIILSMISLSATASSSFVFDESNSIDLMNVVLETVSFWLLWRRKKVARWWIIGICLFNITVGTALRIATGTFNIVTQVGLSSFDIVLILYFLIAKRPKIVLDQTFSLDTYKHEAEEDASLFRPKTWPFWRNLIIYFCVFSVVGHWAEAAYCTLIRFGLLPGVYDPNSQIWSDWLYPFIVYGVGAVACILIFYPLKIFLQKRITGDWKANFINVLITLVVSGIVCCLIELVMGLTMNMDYHLWDYRTMFGNFMGQICLQNGIAFGMIATLMTWVIYPAIEKVMWKLPKEIGNGIFIGVVVGFLLLYCLYLFKPFETVKEDFEAQQQQQQQQKDAQYEGKTPKDVLEEVTKGGLEAEMYGAAAKDMIQKGQYNEAIQALDLQEKAYEKANKAMLYFMDMNSVKAMLNGEVVTINVGTNGVDASNASASNGSSSSQSSQSSQGQ